MEPRLTITTPTIPANNPAVSEAAARWQAKQAARIARKRARANHPAHRAAIARRLASADDRLNATGDATAYRI